VISYVDNADGVSPRQLEGFFDGWPEAPSPETHLRILRASDEIVLAVDGGSGVVVGFITAITDGVLSAYVPLLEVLPRYRGRGIGRELVARMLDALSGYYMIDLVCDEALEGFYRSFGFVRMPAMAIRDRGAQAGRP